MKKIPFRIPAFAKNFYFIFTLLFMTWMLFFDSNDFMHQVSMRNKLIELKDEKAYYEEKIINVREERTNLLVDKKELEKFARENYLMKKKSEDLYVIVEEK